VVARNGVFFRKETGLMTGLVKVEGVAFCDDLKPQVKINLPKLRPLEVAKAANFFRKVYELYRTEAVLVLHYSAEKKRFRFHCPRQTVTSWRVEYDLSDNLPGYVMVGTIHSHPGAARHSMTDVNNEKYFDGLHMIIGEFERHGAFLDISCQAVVNNNRFDVNPRKVMGGLGSARNLFTIKVPKGKYWDVRFPWSWISQVTCKEASRNNESQSHRPRRNRRLGAASAAAAPQARASRS
jgi:proteasome lid subunit RPN8/RPN11